MQTQHATSTARRGLSYLELQVSFVLFGIALSGGGRGIHNHSKSAFSATLVDGDIRRAK